MTIRKCFLGIFAATLLATGGLFAQNGVDNGCEYNNNARCDDSYGCGWTIGAELLIWKPTINDLDYAVTFDSTVNPAPNPLTAVGTYHYIEPDWEPGFRLSVRKDDLWCDWDFSSSYTYMNVTKKDSTSVPAASTGRLFSTLYHSGYNLLNGAGDAASSSYKLKYHSFDLLMSYDYCCDPCHTFTPFYGLETLFLDQDLSHSVTEAGNPVQSTTFTWDSEYWGIGVKLGNKYTYTLNDCMSFYFMGSGSVLTGEMESKHHYVGVRDPATPSNVDLTFKNDDQYVCVFGYHIGTGFTYEKCWCDYLFSATIGYEFIQWYNTPRARRFPDSASDVAISTSPSSSLGFHGFTIGLGMSF